jgi:aspartyl-tRNA(Asn)/glutamyl-tRNA(Gln) amidotransferase subunit B
MKYEPVIGLEVHAQLLTQSKIFCGCSTQFGQAPNHNTCPICTGFPGVLPVLNKKVVAFAIRAGLATHCEIARWSRLARKNYFYPDLPKGYQISQYELPICTNGYLDIAVNGVVKRIRLTRIHIEEDAGKNIHDLRSDASLVDLNRAGVPLLEIVSEPDIRSPEEAGNYLRTLRAILQYLEICDGNMEEGSFRCDANVSVRPEGTTVLGTKIELKNLNSFKAVEKAIEFEIRRQIYRYFPDPDLLPVVIDDKWIDEIQIFLPELPGARKVRFMSQYDIPAYDAELLTSRRDIADYFESAVKTHRNPKAIANWITGDLFRLLKERKLDEKLYITDWPVQADNLSAMIALIDQDKISGKIAKTVFDVMSQSGRSPQEIVAEKGLEQVSNSESIEKTINQVLAAHPKQVAEFQAGNRKIFGFLVGQIMKATQGKANPQKANEILKRKLTEGN